MTLRRWLIECMTACLTLTSLGCWSVASFDSSDGSDDTETSIDAESELFEDGTWDSSQDSSQGSSTELEDSEKGSDTDSVVPPVVDWRNANISLVDVHAGEARCDVPCGVEMQRYHGYPIVMLGATVWVDMSTGIAILLNDENVIVNGMEKGFVFSYENNQYGYGTLFSSADPLQMDGDFEYGSGVPPVEYSKPQFEPIRVRLVHEDSGLAVLVVFSYGEKVVVVHSVTMDN